MDLDLVPQLQEQEVRGQRLRAGQPGAARRAPQHLPEVPVGIGRLHIPQRLAEPGPHLVQVPGVPADGAVGLPTWEASKAFAVLLSQAPSDRRWLRPITACQNF
ncbi:hypothetical protein QBC31_39680 [Streptomyces sp. B21-079]|uniref:hypothetical protein n=1 Tax=Streptomyces sp. B21-079 TaxID=3039409 RepID=UPI002FEEA9B1